MKRILVTIFAAVLLASCSDKPSVQKYFVQKAEEKNFIAVDIAPSIIKTDKLKLKEDEKKALESLDHINVLYYKADTPAEVKQLEKEQAEVKSILGTDSYDELIKFNSKQGSGSLNTKGKDEHIEEFVIYMHQKDSGLSLVRVTGNDMTPTNVMTIAGLISKGGLDMQQLKPLQQMMQPK